MSRYLMYTGAVVILSLAAAGVAEGRGPGGGGGGGGRSYSGGNSFSRFQPNVFRQRNGVSNPSNTFMSQTHKQVSFKTQSLKTTKSGYNNKHHKHDHDKHHRHHRHHLDLGDLGMSLDGEPVEDDGAADSDSGDAADLDGDDTADSTSSMTSASASDADADATDGDSDDADQSNETQWQTQRHLKVKNDSGKVAKVYLQYRTQQENGDFAWMPADPEKSKKTVSFVLKPGETRELEAKDGPIAASRVRFWAVSKAKKWMQYKGKDLWLVPEVGDDGEHRYEGDETETYTLTLPR